MSLNVKCDRCDQELVEKGALIFSPPQVLDGIDVVQKYHICVSCYEWLIEVTVKKDDQSIG